MMRISNHKAYNLDLFAICIQQLCFMVNFSQILFNQIVMEDAIYQLLK